MGATIADILAQKGNSVTSIAPDATVKEAARLMNKARVGALVVLDGDTLVGIFTERDVLTRVVAAERDPVGTLVKDVMTTPVHSCRPSTALIDCKRMMSERRFRHLPIVERGKVVGMISSGDIMANTLHFQEQMLEYLNEYLHGRH
jgi:CBS domain-containing protein